MSKKGIRRLVITAVVAFILLITAINCFTVVEAGHTGVVVTLGKVNDGVLQEGIHVKLNVTTEAFSKDLQSVSTELAVNYRVDKDKSFSIYKNIGANYEQVLLEPAVNEVLKAITAKYTAEESVTNRVMVSEGLVEGLNEKLNAIGLYVTDVNIINFDFSEAFINAIEEKQIAQQQLLKAETDKQTAITNAEAAAEAVRIKAQAEADANKTISESLTEMMLEYSKIEKWDGKLPTVVGNDSNTLFDITSAVNSEEK